MNPSTWVILGATSIIAEQFAHQAAQAGCALLLVARNQQQLEVIAADIHLRYAVTCTVLAVDFMQDMSELINEINGLDEINLFIAHSLIINNDQLTQQSIAELIQVNVVSTIQVIHAYLQKKQTQHRLLYVSSVAACRGRAKNSLYGASKATIEIYLQGLQQAAPASQTITIARLGFIDTKSTYGEPGIFYASPPKACARACWRAVIKQKRIIYHPFFWRYLMGLISLLPFFLYKKMGKL